MTARARLTSGLAVALGALALASCGVDTEEAGLPNQDERAQQQETPEEVREQRRRRLPRRPDGVAAVSVPQQGALTPIAQEGFEGEDDTRLQLSRAAETQAFRDLCEGRVDVVEATREMTEAEARLCERNGLDLVVDPESERIIPFQVGADAIVLATKNEADVGGDCLTLGTVREIFRSGSPIDSWAQVGFDDIPLATTGPPAQSNDFAFFAAAVLGVESAATTGDLRADYRVRTTSARVRREVTNEGRVEAAERRARARLRNPPEAVRAERRRYVRQEIEEASERVVANIERENRARARRNRPAPANLEQRNRRRVQRAQDRARRRANREFDRRALAEGRRWLRGQLERVDQPGVFGIFRFTYYELFENQLRPMELWDPARMPLDEDGDGEPDEAPAETAPAQTGTAPGQTATAPGPALNPNPYCVFPSQRTIVDGSYPLARRFLLYTTQQGLERDEVSALLTWYLQNATQLATENRLVPVDELTRQRNEQMLTGEVPERPGADPSDDPREGPGTTPRAPGPGGVPGVGTNPGDRRVAPGAGFGPQAPAAPEEDPATPQEGDATP